MKEKKKFRKDLFFKIVFGGNDDLSRGALSDLLSAYLQKPVKDVHVIANEVYFNYARQKKTRMDINCIFNSGELANVEMQLVNTKEELFPRMVYYLLQLFMSQDMSNKEYHDLKNTYLILICDFKLFDDDKQYHRFMFRDDKANVLSELLQLITIELVKVKDKDVNEMDKIERWNYFLENYEKENKSVIIKVIKEREEGITMAEQKYKGISNEQAEYIIKVFDDLYELEEKKKEEKRLKVKFEEGLSMGKQQGIQKGKKEERIQMVNKLLKKFSTDEVASMLGLSVDEIESLKKCM